MLITGLIRIKLPRYPFDLKITKVAFPTLTYIFFYSFLPHKELRFLFPITPGLVILAAIGLQKMSNSMFKSYRTNQILVALSTSLLIANVFIVATSAYASHYNYPGGKALS